MTIFRDDLPLADARAALLQSLDAGVECPCCLQTARVYRRSLTAVAARALIALWRVHGQRYGHLPAVARDHLADVQGQGGYLVLSAHWGLMTPESAGPGVDGRAGYWSVTDRGVGWLLGRCAVAKYARIYNGDCLGFEGPMFTVTDALAGRFDLESLLGPRPVDPAAGVPLELFPPDQPARPLEAVA